MAQSFGSAFKAARKAQGAGGTFTWNGKSYSTDQADDKKTTRPRKKPVTSSPRPKVNPTRTSKRPKANPRAKPDNPSLPTKPVYAGGTRVETRAYSPRPKAKPTAKKKRSLYDRMGRPFT